LNFKQNLLIILHHTLPASWDLYEKKKNVPDTNGKELSPTVDKIRAEYLDGLQE